MKGSRAGFTLVELMIALVAGAFAVAAVYYLNGVSSRGFAEQMRVAETQMSLRSAMEQLRRDFARAGYLGVPNSNLVPNCDGSPSNGTGDVAPRLMRAIQVTRDGSLADATVNQLMNAAKNLTRADTVDLWGNYATADAYQVDPTLSSTNSIVLQPTMESFRRSFYTPTANNGAATWNPAAFAAAFAPGNSVRIESDGRVFFRDIDPNTPAPPTTDPSVSGNPWPSVLLTGNPLPTACFNSSSWAAIAPIVHLQYDIEPDSRQDLGRLQSQATATATATNFLPGARRTMLVRRQWNDNTGLVTPGTSLLILDYAVEFSVDLLVNTQAAGLTPAWAWQRGNSATTFSAATGTPEMIRSLSVTLTARSAEVDPKLPGFPGGTNPRVFDNANLLNSPMLLFQVTDPLTSQALYSRVRTLRSEIFLQNQ